jgi:hypothetical protein
VPTAHLIDLLKEFFWPVSGLTTCLRLHSPSHLLTVALNTVQLFTVAGAALEYHQIPVYLQLSAAPEKAAPRWSRVQFSPRSEKVNSNPDG